MKTFEFIKDYLNNTMKLALTDNDVRLFIQKTAVSVTASKADLKPLSGASDTFKIGESGDMIQDGTLVVYRAIEEAGLISPDNVLSLEEFDYHTQPHPIPAEAVLVDFSQSILKFKDFINSLDKIHITAFTLNFDNIVTEALAVKAITNRNTEEKRGNVTIKKKSYADLYNERMAAQLSSSNSGFYEGNMTRLSGGEVYGSPENLG